MTSVLRRAVAPFAAVTALVATLSACGTGPSQVNSAVIIGDHVISVDEVQALVDKVAQDPAARSLVQNHNLDLVGTEAVTQLVRHQLITEAAKKENLQVDRDEVSALRADFDQEIPTDGSIGPEQLVPVLVARARGFDAYANDTLLQSELVKEYVGRVSVTYNAAQFTDFDSAKELAEKVAARPDDAEELMQSAASEGQQQPELGATTNPDSGLPLQLNLPDKSVMVVNNPGDGQTPGGYIVFQVLSTEVTQDSAGELNPDELDPRQLAPFGAYMVRSELLDTSFRVSPRFGAWNMAEMKVVPKAEVEVAGMLLLPKNDKP